MKTIVVPLDGSQLAEQALPLAAAIAAKQDSHVVLATAIEAGDRWVDDGFVRKWESEEQAAVEAYLARAVERMRERGVHAKAHIEWGRPDVVIRTAAEGEDAGLIVMTTHGRSGVSRWVLGSVADKVLRGTDIPLILIRPAEDVRPPESVGRVAVCLDGSPLAESALPEAQQLALAMEAPLLLIRSVVPPAALYGAELVPGSLPVLGQLEADARDYLEDVAERVKEHGLDVSVAVAVGPAAAAVLETASEGEADLIVMTTHGRSGLERWAFGSVADAVVRRGELPVMIVRPAPGEIEEALEGVPVAGNAVVPPPKLEERALPSAAAAQAPEPRPHRPERQQGR